MRVCTTVGYYATIVRPEDQKQLSAAICNQGPSGCAHVFSLELPLSPCGYKSSWADSISTNQVLYTRAGELCAAACAWAVLVAATLCPLLASSQC